MIHRLDWFTYRIGREILQTLGGVKENDKYIVVKDSVMALKLWKRQKRTKPYKYFHVAERRFCILCKNPLAKLKATYCINCIGPNSKNIYAVYFEDGKMKFTARVDRKKWKGVVGSTGTC